MKILLTGAIGVIGLRTLPLLLKAGHRVTAVARVGASPLELDMFAPDRVRGAVRGHDDLATRAFWSS